MVEPLRVDLRAQLLEQGLLSNANEQVVLCVVRGACPESIHGSVSRDQNALPSDIILDRKGTYKQASADKTVSADVKLNLRNGQVSLRLKAPSGTFGFSPATMTTPKPTAHVSFSNDRADYFADFTLNYASKGKSGSAK